MHNEITEKLRSIEEENDVKILFALESGSRGWGFASSDSDYDVRFIYIHKTDWYLSVDTKKDFIEYPVDDLLDVNGWDIKKSLLLFKKSNPPLLEWLTSPIIYREEFTSAQKLRELTHNFFAPIPTLYHYLHIAKNKFEEIMNSERAKIKKYFYILRPLLACMWIEKNNSMPPMEFSKLMADIDLEPALLIQINILLDKKISGEEIDLEPRHPIIIDFLSTKINHFEQYLKTARNENTSDYTLLNQFFRETLKEVWG